MELNTVQDVGVVQNALATYIREDAQVDWSDAGMPKSPIKEMTPGLEANAYYFGHLGVGAELFQVIVTGASGSKSRWRARRPVGWT